MKLDCEVNKQWFIWTHQWMKMVEMMADGSTLVSTPNLSYFEAGRESPYAYMPQQMRRIIQKCIDYKSTDNHN